MKPERIVHTSRSLREMLKETAGKGSRVACMLLRGLNNPRSYLLADKLFGDYFTFREKTGLISYMPAGKEQLVNEDGTWSLKGRQAIAPGKWARSMLHPRLLRLARIKDNEFADISTAVKHAEAEADLRCEFRPFVDAYNQSLYRKEFNSCMWGCDVGPFYNLFGAKALVCIDRNEKFCGRCVVWPGVDVGKDFDVTFADRIYSDSPEVEEFIKAHIKSNGWYHKVKQARGAAETAGPDKRGWFVISATSSRPIPSHGMFYPYLDTLFYSNGNTLTTDDCGQDYQYNNTDGTRYEVERDSCDDDDHEGQVCTDDGDWISEEDAVRIGNSWYNVNSGYVCYVDEDDEYNLRQNCTRINGKWYRDDSDSIVTTHDGEAILRENAVEIDCEWYDKEYAIECLDGTWVLTDDAVDVDGDWYHKDSNEIVCVDDVGYDQWFLRGGDDVVFCEYDGRWHLKENCHEFLGKWYHIHDMHIDGGRFVPDGWVDPNQLPLPIQVDTTPAAPAAVVEVKVEEPVYI